MNSTQGDPSPCAKPPVDLKSKVLFGLACPGLANPKRNFTFEVNGRFCTRRRVTLYLLPIAYNDTFPNSQLCHCIQYVMCTVDHNLHQ